MNLNPKTTITITEARRRIFEIAEQVQKPDSYYTLTENGKPKAVIMSAEEFDAWQETLEVDRQFPNLKEDAKEAWEEYKRGETTPLEKVLKEYGYVPRRPRHKGHQRSKKA